ncbi:MAG: GTPase HflX [Mycoplasmatales bacterium]
MNSNEIMKTRVVLVGVDNYRDKQFDYYMEELKNLAEACGFEIVGQLTQKMQKIDNRTYIGSGKTKELIDILEDSQADMIIVNNELSGSQHRNIERIIDIKVMDRTFLILEIFSRRAKTREAKLQVAIAKLKYQKPRMIGSYEGLDRQGGGGMNKGTGETQLETDIRKIDTKIFKYEDELKKLVTSREVQRQQRNMPIVAVVGYTNVGKSTLMNALVEEDKNVFEKDMLFATLDTSVRMIKLPTNQQFLLVDTVGFVSNLSHDLVKAFRSTLEEILQADLVIHLQDLTNESQEVHKIVVYETLKTLGADKIPTLDVYNKMDIASIEIDYTNINISAKANINLDKLLDQIQKKLYVNYKTVELHFPYSNAGIQVQLISNHEVFKIEYEQDYISMILSLSPEEVGIYKKYIAIDSKKLKAHKLLKLRK